MRASLRRETLLLTLELDGRKEAELLDLQQLLLLDDVWVSLFATNIYRDYIFDI